MQFAIISLFFLLLFVAGYYSFVVLPRQRAFKQQYTLVTNMKVGDEVITYGGLVGSITKIDADTGLVTLELAKGVEVRVLAMAINQSYEPEALAETARKVNKGRG